MTRVAINGTVVTDVRRCKDRALALIRDGRLESGYGAVDVDIYIEVEEFNHWKEGSCSINHRSM